MKNISILLIAIIIMGLLFSCKRRIVADEGQNPLVSVTAEPLATGNIENSISFNGSTIYLKKTSVISPISGYIVKADVRFGQEVRKNDMLFAIQTREGKVLQNTGSDTSALSGIMRVRSNSDGFIDKLNVNGDGAFVAEGSVLCDIANNNDLMISLNVPFENIAVPVKDKRCKISLPDGSVISGSVLRIIPSVDGTNQTQTILIKPESGRSLPENLNLQISFVNEKRVNALLVSQSSLMTNETQTEFWVMKIDRGNMAVKIPVTKGLENDSITEIISPDLHKNDLIITNGAYGLPDSTLVSIKK